MQLVLTNFKLWLLLRRLRHADAGKRCRAATGLGRLGDCRAIDALVVAVTSDDDLAVRESAAAAIARLPDPRAIDRLAASLGAPVPKTRSKVVKALQAFGPAAAGLAVPLLDDPDDDVRQVAVDTVAKAGADQALGPLLAALRSGRPQVQSVVARALGQLGDQRAVEPLIAALASELQPTRLAAADALGKLGDGRAVEPLIASLKDPSADIVVSAMRSLGVLGDRRAVEPVATALAASDWVLWSRGGDVLAKLGGRRAAAVLEAAAFNTSLDWRVGRNAVFGLCKIEGGDAVAALVRILRTRPHDAVKVRARLADLLTRSAGVIARDDLEQIADLDQLESRYYAEQGGEVREALDCTSLRELARHELARRGVGASGVT